jgi:DNA-binding NarL/FixJ family response regulator
MLEERLSARLLRLKHLRRETRLEPEEVSAMLRLKELGWGAKRIAGELGISRNTMKKGSSCG